MANTSEIFVLRLNKYKSNHPYDVKIVNKFECLGDGLYSLASQFEEADRVVKVDVHDDDHEVVNPYNLSMAECLGALYNVVASIGCDDDYVTTSKSDKKKVHLKLHNVTMRPKNCDGDHALKKKEPPKIKEQQTIHTIKHKQEICDNNKSGQGDQGRYDDYVEGEDDEYGYRSLNDRINRDKSRAIARKKKKKPLRFRIPD